MRTPNTKNVTVLFCDIRNFTSLFDDRDPTEAIEFANSVLAVLGEIIEDHGGIVDRFTGDGFLAHFGLNDDESNHALQACNAIKDIRSGLNKVNMNRYFSEQTVVTVGIGINTGTVASGIIKTNQFEQHTILGDVVNTTARIEQMTKYFMVDVLVSESTYNETSDHFSFQKMPLKSVPGKKKLIQTYWLLPIN